MNRRDFNSLVAGGLAAGVLSPRWRAILQTDVRVNGDRVNAHLTALAEFGKNPQGGVSRVAYGDADRAARTVVMDWMRAAKLEPKVDFAGNIIGRRPGTDASLKPIVFGSHIDSVPEGGNYDGDVGSMSAIEVAQTLAEHNISTRHPLEVAIWQNEEGGLYGSRALSGQLVGSELKNISSSGKTIEQGISFLGGDPTKLDEVKRRKGDIAAYFELHIEQGGILDANKTDIGVVEGIVGIKQWEVTVTGFANHAGTTPMDQRHDALLAASRFVEMVNRVVRSIPGRQVGTVGRIQAFPGAPNVIPGKVVCTLELRDLDDAKVDSMYAQIQTEAKKIGAENGTQFAYSELHVNAAAPSDPRMRAIITDAAKGLGLSTRAMPSGAGHDAQAMALLGPVGMIFVPSVGGISHSPKEFSRPKDIVNGANVLLRTVLAADRL
ncbi:MAG TPA: Zn-dependent hydrolase [Gemmatimonadaceae bacterium]|jgi:N-carbamoyl-L-amino-acid hydrolase|nr:Zn-dependent hydrolase [Gemmatimonadaceae bacterium]